MADHAVRMAEAGVNSIVVLGVDFMSENVRAVFDLLDMQMCPYIASQSAISAVHWLSLPRP